MVYIYGSHFKKISVVINKFTVLGIFLCYNKYLLHPWAGVNYTTRRCVQHPKLVIKSSLDNQVIQPVSQLIITWGFISGQIL